MTALVFSLIESLSGHPQAEANSYAGACPMKGLVVGMLLFMAAGAEGFVFIPDGPLSVQQQFFFGLIAGSLGTLAGLAMYGAPNIILLARQAFGNLLLAAVFAPALAWCFFGKDVTVPFLAPIAGTLGVGGSVLFMKIWPMLMELAANRAKAEAKRILGEDMRANSQTDAGG